MLSSLVPGILASWLILSIVLGQNGRLAFCIQIHPAFGNVRQQHATSCERLKACESSHVANMCIDIQAAAELFVVRLL